MNRVDLEHIVRAAAGITGAAEIVIVGSQAVLGQYPDAPAELRTSIEADVFTLRSAADAELIDGSIGERSPFHDTFGYYARGVARETAVLPSGWEERLVRIRNSNTGSGVGLCLEAHDLFISKLVAGRDKDLRFVSGMLRHHLIDPQIVWDRLEQTELDDERRRLSRVRLDRLRREAGV